ncbi:MAG: helix-turn-helix domain-containing protein [Oxalobacteraceae bacterium]|nr:helix-turn-helix domain-containing protein [Oxalobacteraceae bacterium]
MNTTYTLDELCALTALPKRTVRYYVQLGLVDRPEGETRAARYFQRHLEQLLTVRRLSEGGLSLDRIAAVLKGDIDAVTEPRRAPGTVEVRAHITVADGVDIQIETSRLGIGPEQLRRFTREVIALYERIQQEKPDEPTP